MKPSFLPGDMVTVRGGTPALVIGVSRSNQVPDAQERGLTTSQPYDYWVMTSGKRVRFMGPFRGFELEAYA